MAMSYFEAVSIQASLSKLESKINQLEEWEGTIMSEFDDIKAAQEATKVALANIATDQAGLVAKIDALIAAGADAITPEKLQELRDNALAIQATAEGIDAAVASTGSNNP
jgi:hypothetical protein